MTTLIDIKKLLQHLVRHQHQTELLPPMWRKIWHRACLPLTGQNKRKGAMEGAEVGEEVVEGVTRAVEQDNSGTASNSG